MCSSEVCDWENGPTSSLNIKDCNMHQYLNAGIVAVLPYPFSVPIMALCAIHTCKTASPFHVAMGLTFYKKKYVQYLYILKGI